MTRINAYAAEAVTHYAGGLIDQLAAKEADRLRLERRVRNRFVLVLILGVDVLAFLTLIIISVTGSGNGYPTGWRGVLGDVAVGFLLFAPVLLIWALVSWIRGPRRKRLSELREKFAAEAKRLIDDVDNVLYADWIIPVIAEVVKEAENRLEPSFTSTLHLTDPSVFSSSKDGEFKTSAFSQIAELLAESDGGSIGLCGPRGAGKSTIIHHFCQSTKGIGPPQVIGICVNAPVVYAQRDFLANIYNSMIKEAKKVVEGKPGSRSPVRWHAFGWGIAASGFLAAVAAAILSRRFGNQLPGWLSFTGIWVLVTATLALVVLSALAWRANAREAGNEAGPLLQILEKAESGLLNLSADVALSSSLSGSVTLPWAGFTRSGARQVSRGAVSYPDLVDDFRDFVCLFEAAGLHARIGIDELDKLEPDEARSCLRELKAILGFPNTHFVISISENAISDFGRRGLPIRDAFGSFLDEVIWIQEMDAEQSIELLSSCGKYDFPPAFGALCYCLSGGLPRELLRTARRLVRHNARCNGTAQFGLLKSLCEQIIRQDLETRTEALWASARSIDAGQYSVRFRTWLSQNDASQNGAKHQSAEQLLSTCQKYLELDTMEKIPDMPESKIALERLASLALEYVGYKYFAATILDFFSRAVDQDLRSALKASAGAGNIAILSSARARFADDPRLAWSLVTQFRQAHKINPDLPPPTEGLRLPGHASAR